jgi:hypothetical protein
MTTIDLPVFLRLPYFPNHLLIFRSIHKPFLIICPMVSHLDRYWAADVKYDTETVWQLDTALGIRMLVLNCFGVATIDSMPKSYVRKSHILRSY